MKFYSVLSKIIIICAVCFAFSGHSPAIADSYPCPTSGPWTPGCTPGGQTSTPSQPGQPCPTSGPWTPGCVPGGQPSTPSQPAPSGGQPCPTSGPWTPGCVPGGQSSTPSQPEQPGPTPSNPGSVFNGNGSSVLDLRRTRQFQLVKITVQQPRSHFSVWSYDYSGNRVDLLANEIADRYTGIFLIDGQSERRTVNKLEVTSSGSWTVELLPLSAATPLNRPGNISSTSGAYVLKLDGQSGNGQFQYNSARGNFIVWAMDAGGKRLDLLVNEIGWTDSTVVIPSGTTYLSVEADGNWKVTLP